MPKKKIINGDSHKPATIGHIEELARMTNSAFQQVPTKKDAEQFLTKEDARQFATKQDVREVKQDVQEVKDKQDLMQSDVERLVRGQDKILETLQVMQQQHTARDARVEKLDHRVTRLELQR